MLIRLAERGVNISLVWIKAHVGHTGNERADELAKLGTELDVEESVWVSRPFSFLARKSEGRMYGEWGNEWRNCGIARMIEEFFPVD